MRRALAIVCALASSLAPGCDTDRWYADPGNEVVRYEDLARPARPMRFRIDSIMVVEGLRHPSPKLQSDLRARVLEVVAKSGLIEISRATTDPSLLFLLDADPKQASNVKRQGPGATVKWVQEMTVYADTGGEPLERNYVQTIQIHRGKSPTPELPTAPMNPRKLHDQVVESMVLQALRDLQRIGLLPVAESG